MKLHPLHPASWVLDRLTDNGWHIHELLSFTRSGTLVLADWPGDEPVVVKCGFGSNHVLAAMDDADRPAAYGFYWYQKMTPAERATARDDFRHECDLTRDLSGAAHLVPLLGWGDCDEFDWYTMPHYPNGNFGDHMQRMPQSQRIAVLADVAAALADLHQRGVVHRDIYQENILIGRHSDGVVTDLGAAYRIGQPRGPRQRGPELHWPPEYATNYDSATPAADVYSLAVLTYRALFDDIPRLAGPTTTATISPDLTELVVGALAKQPQDRPTMAELNSSLRTAAAAPAFAAVNPTVDDQRSWRISK